MSDKPSRTLDQITQDVLNSHFGISEEDLQLLFSDTSTDKTKSPTTPTATPSVETATHEPEEPATAEPEPTETPTPTEKPAQTVPPASTPEPSRAGEDSFESSLKSQKEQMDKIQLLLNELLRKSQAPGTTDPVAPTAQTPTMPNPLDEIDDQAIIEKPKETITKLVQGILKIVLPAAFTEYDVAVNKKAAMEAFRKSKPDFDELRPIMRQIVLESPTANDDPAALPRIYEEAKQRKAVYLEAMRRELSIPAPVVPAPAPQPSLSEEDILAKLEQRIAEKIRKRRSGAGAASPTTQPVLPTDRMTEVPRELPKTEADVMLEAMLKAGLPSTGFLKDVETIKK